MLTEKINNIKNNYMTQDNQEISFGCSNNIDSI